MIRPFISPEMIFDLLDALIMKQVQHWLRQRLAEALFIQDKGFRGPGHQPSRQMMTID